MKHDRFTKIETLHKIEKSEHKHEIKGVGEYGVKIGNDQGGLLYHTAQHDYVFVINQSN